MAKGVNLALGLHDLPDGRKQVKLMIQSGDVLHFIFLMEPAEAESVAKAMQSAAIQAKTGLVVPTESRVVPFS